jgi:hypothetical protein
MPLSTMSAASSGGVCSSATFTASTICADRFGQASAIWRWVMTISFGTPFIRSRPLISMVTPSPSSAARRSRFPS